MVTIGEQGAMTEAAPALVKDTDTWSEVQKKRPRCVSPRDAARLADLEIPLDEYNAVLLDNVHPRAWDSPDPAGVVYDLVALGAGAAGLVSAKRTARRGGRSALVEMHLHGGDCLSVGCVPSKALIRAARAVKEAKHSAEFGVNVGEVTVNFPLIMERMRKLRARIAPTDAVSVTAGVGADVFQGKGVFTGRNTLEVNNKTLHFKKAVVCTGGSPSVPPIPGLKEIPYVTNRTLFNLEALPPRMLVVGAGPIGLEMAQSFALFGSAVTVLDVVDKVLAREDQDAAEIVADSARKDGVAFALGIKNLCFSSKSSEGSAVVITATFELPDGSAQSLDADTLLVAAGRVPNVQGLGLAEAGVEYDPRKGVAVNDLMQTTNPDIYAIGDCASALQFTHLAGMQADLVIENAVFGGNRTMSSLVIPRCTYTSPEVAGTGMSEQEVTEKGWEFDTFMSKLEHNDRAILEGSDRGFCKLLVKRDTGKILGGTIVADHAGESISEVTLAIHAGIDIETLSRMIHPYPTVAEAIAGCAFQYKVKNWQKKSSD